MGFNLGIAFGSAMTSGIKTYGDLLKLKEMKQDLDAQTAERDAMKTAAQGNTSEVTPGSLATQYQGADGKADPDAVMGTYGALQSGDPSQAAATINQGAADAQSANAAAAPPTPQTFQGSAPPPAAGIGAPPPTAMPPADPNAPVAGAATQTDGSGQGSNIPAVTSAIMHREGGYVADDNGHGPTNYGINGQANGLTPEQVKNLTPQQAADIYAKKYLGPSGANIDAMNPQQAQIVGDTAVNQGPAKAEQWYQQSGGDMNKFLELRANDYANIEKTQPQNKPTWDARMADMQHFINKNGTAEQHGEGDHPVAPSTKLTPLNGPGAPSNVTSAPVTGVPVSAAQGAPSGATYGQDAQGNVTQNTPTSAADRLQAMANAAYKAGDIKGFPAIQQAAITARAQEGAQQVQAVMTNSQLTGDQKVSQLTRLAGVQAYKTEQGNYLVPGLGPTDAQGRPMPMTLGQVGALASFATTPEGQHYLMDAQQKQQTINIEQQNANTTASKAPSEIAEAQARANLTGKQGDYYEANANATNAAKGAQADNAKAEAAERQEQANLRNKMGDLEQQMAALDPKAPDYQVQMDHLRAQHDMLVQRGGGKIAPPPGPITVKDGQTQTDADGSNPRTYMGSMGSFVPSAKVPLVQAAQAEIAKNPTDYQINGAPLVQVVAVPGGKPGTGDAGVMLDPSVSAKLGLDPKQLYPTPQAAMNAYKTAYSKQRGALPPGVPMSAAETPGNQLPAGIGSTY